VSTHAANHHEVRLVQLCFDFYMIEAKPENLIGDRAYDSDPLHGAREHVSDRVQNAGLAVSASPCLIRCLWFAVTSGANRPEGLALALVAAAFCAVVVLILTDPPIWIAKRTFQNKKAARRNSPRGFSGAATPAVLTL